MLYRPALDQGTQMKRLMGCQFASWAMKDVARVVPNLTSLEKAL